VKFYVFYVKSDLKISCVQSLGYYESQKSMKSVAAMGYAKFDIAEYPLKCVSDVIFVFYDPENPIKDILLAQVGMLRCHFRYRFLVVVAVLKKMAAKSHFWWEKSESWSTSS